MGAVRILCSSSGGSAVVISRFVVGAALLGLLAGCTSDWDPGRAARLGAAGDAEVPQSGDGFLRIASASRAAALSGSTPFASLPDRGALLAYDRGAKPRVSGAYRAYSVRLSEEHALKAAHDGGQIELVAPNGEPIELAYERHIEHPDGNWTWIGRDASGADAVITFGAKAVVGSIPFDGQEPLRLTMAGGRSWLVETDGDKVVDADHAAMRASGEPDYFIPPKLAIGAAADKAIAASAQATKPAAAAAAAQTTVDVLLGYTNGFATAQGGQSQAVTRLTNLIDIANQAYSNSGITARLRLVGTVAVAYTDANDNGLALEKLSGFDDDGPITPDPAFAALRAARNSLGADLVSLVRDFRTPENAGCGIAWLIGGGQTPIVQADEPYGYSVVSDGSDVDEGDGNTYFCRDESLAHELGHNMGQAHNIDDSSSTGAHTYSYGYRESTTSGFYTVMAYRLAGSSQFAIRHFANPDVNYDGRPTGVDGEADNTRSMNVTMPIIATFRDAASLTARNDFDGNGRTDLVFRHVTSADFALWLMSGYSQRIARGGTRSSTYRVATIADVDGDGKAEIVWTSDSRDLIFTSLDGSAFQSVTSTSKYTAGYAVVGSADMNGDGSAELVLHNSGTGAFSVWFMDNFVRKSSISGTMPAAHRLVGTADFDGDGRQDLLWTSAAKNLRYVSYIGGSLVFHASPSNYYTSAYAIVGAADVEGNGKSEIVLHNAATGQYSIWFIGTDWLRKSSKSDTVPVGYKLSSMGDFAGTGKEDLLWTNDQRKLLFSTWSQGQIQSTLAYAAGYRPADGP